MKIGIEPNLSNIKDYLEDQGLQCTTINATSTTNLNSFDCIVVTGQNDNMMGIEDTDTKAKIIECTGMTPQEVYDEIQDMM